MSAIIIGGDRRDCSVAPAKALLPSPVTVSSAEETLLSCSRGSCVSSEGGVVRLLGGSQTGARRGGFSCARHPRMAQSLLWSILETTRAQRSCPFWPTTTFWPGTVTIQSDKGGLPSRLPHSTFPAEMRILLHPQQGPPSMPGAEPGAALPK